MLETIPCQPISYSNYYWIIIIEVKGTPTVTDIAVPRWVGRGSDTLQCEIHGVSDASASAFGTTHIFAFIRYNSKFVVDKIESRAFQVNKHSSFRVNYYSSFSEEHHIRTKFSLDGKYPLLLLDGFYRHVHVDTAWSFEIEVSLLPIMFAESKLNFRYMALCSFVFKPHRLCGIELRKLL